jgi:hypothetical protein
MANSDQWDIERRQVFAESAGDDPFPHLVCDSGIPASKKGQSGGAGSRGRAALSDTEVV